MSTITVEHQNMRGTGRAILIVLLIVQVIVVFAVLEPFSITWRSSSNVPVSVAAPTNDLPLTLESGEATATAIARSWRDETRLVSAVMQVEWPTESATEVTTEMPSGGWIIYTFVSEQSTLSVMLDRKSGAFITSATGESGNDAWPTLELQNHTRSSATAVLTADLLEGSAFRNACPSSRSSALVTLSAAPDDTGERRSVWTVTYGDSRFPATFDVLVRLYADTGNVLTSERQDRPCSDNVISYMSSSPPRRS
jgi:hypothetical protein